MATEVQLDQDKLEAFVERIVLDVGTAMRGGLVYIGDRLGIFAALAQSGPVTATELAGRTGLNERYLREWLGSMTTAEYLEHDSEADTYFLPPEHALPLADEEFPFFTGGFLQMIVPTVTVAPAVAEAFKTGGGVTQDQYLPDMYEAIERATAPWYKHHLVQTWLPAMPGVQEKLEAGGSACDVGCGSGRAPITLAKAFPAAEVHGYDVHPGSIERARATAQGDGVTDRVTFTVGDGAELPEGQFDLISTFDVVHDSVGPGRADERDPRGVAGGRHVPDARDERVRRCRGEPQPARQAPLQRQHSLLHDHLARSWAAPASVPAWERRRRASWPTRPALRTSASSRSRNRSRSSTSSRHRNDSAVIDGSPHSTQLCQQTILW